MFHNLEMVNLYLSSCFNKWHAIQYKCMHVLRAMIAKDHWRWQALQILEYNIYVAILAYLYIRITREIILFFVSDAVEGDDSRAEKVPPSPTGYIMPAPRRQPPRGAGSNPTVSGTRNRWSPEKMCKRATRFAKQNLFL